MVVLISLGIIPLDVGNGLQLCYERHQPKPPTMSRPWTQEDIEALSSLAGDLPWPMVTGAFNCTRPPRTELALRRKAYALRITRTCVGQFITCGTIAEMSGNDFEKVRRWVTSGKLPSRRFGEGNGHAYFVNRKDLRTFAAKHPESFGGLTQGQLVVLLDSEKLAARIASMELPRLVQRVAVECIETGQKFPSISAAAKAAYVAKERMRTVIREGTTANGRHYRRVQPACAQPRTKE